MDARHLAWADALVRLEGMRTLPAGQAAQPFTLLLNAPLAILSIVLAWFVFTCIHRHTMRIGLPARYSAETLS